MQVKGVIFDCDGTLVNSTEAWLGTQNEMARRAGVKLTSDDVDYMLTLSIPETGAYLHDKYHLGNSGNEVVDMINETMLDYYENDSTARIGALSFVKSLYDQGIPCSVASSTPQALLQAGLARAGFTPYLSYIVSVDDVGISKSRPAVFDRARELMGTEKEATWVFEDSAYALKTSVAAGYPSVGIYDDDLSGTYEQLSIGKLVVREWDELDPLIFVEDPLSAKRDSAPGVLFPERI